MSISEDLGKSLKENNLRITTAESCTAGMIAAKIADTPGSSAWLDSGYVVYTPEAKNRILGVKLETIEKYNITSVEVAEEMARGAWSLNKDTNIAVAITGVAGPGGGTNQIPVGTVCIAWLYKLPGMDEPFIETAKLHLSGDRNEIRERATDIILASVLKKLDRIYSRQTLASLDI